jgi:hypothetical protein
VVVFGKKGGVKILKITAIADKIMPYLVKNTIENEFFGTDLDGLQKLFPDESRRNIELAVNMLRADNLATAGDYDDEPRDIQADLQGIRKIEENTLIRKGYNFLKELRQLL